MYSDESNICPAEPQARPMFEKLLLIAFATVTAIQLFFWLYFFSRLAFYKQIKDERQKNGDNPKKEKEPVSIIICAHNEEENLRERLDRFLNQIDRSHEVLVVLHNSHDKSRNVLSYLHHRFKQLRVIECDDPRPGKKFALAKGIKEAKHEVLLLTDADCVPNSKKWMDKMAATIDGKTEIVLGFGPLEEAPNPLNKFIRFEAVYTAMQYLSFALAGIPYMGVGRNLAYRKVLFKKAGGFQSHEHIASGDDDLFINAVATRSNTRIQLDPDTFIYSPAKKTWPNYYRQKRRHYSTGQDYQLHHKALLGLLAVSHFLHYILGGIIVIYKFSIIFALLGYAVRMCVAMIFSRFIFKRLRHSNLWIWFPLLDALLILFYVIFTPAISMNNDTQKWN